MGADPEKEALDAARSNVKDAEAAARKADESAGHKPPRPHDALDQYIAAAKARMKAGAAYTAAGRATRDDTAESHYGAACNEYAEGAVACWTHAIDIGQTIDPRTAEIKRKLEDCMNQRRKSYVAAAEDCGRYGDENMRKSPPETDEASEWYDKGLKLLADAESAGGDRPSNTDGVKRHLQHQKEKAKPKP